MNIPETPITQAQLRKNNGDRGTPKWVACKGIVYDVSECSRWRRDMHMGLHFPGQDLTDELAQAPHNEMVFMHPCVKVVGRLQTEP